MNRALAVAGLAMALAPLASRAAGTLQSAEVTRVYNSVQLLAPDQPAAVAKIGDDITGKTAVQTGNKSRAELEFNDQTIARLGANSVFSFERGTRDLNLNEGVILLEVPKNAGGATINTAAITAAVTGTTVMIEFHKGDKPSNSTIKFIVLEGTMKLKMKGPMGESILLTAGQIVTLNVGAKHFPEPQFVDVDRLTKTSGLMSKQFGTLKNEPFIFNTVSQQKLLKVQGKLITLNYGLYGKRKNPILQVTSSNNQSTLRTDATVVSKPPKPKPVDRPVIVKVVNHPKPVPPAPPVKRPPQPPPQPPKPKPPQPVPPPPVPPAPPDRPT